MKFTVIARVLYELADQSYYEVVLQGDEYGERRANGDFDIVKLFVSKTEGEKMPRGSVFTLIGGSQLN